MQLRYINKQGISREIELTGEPVAIGRSREAFIPLLDDKVSRAHCGIRLSEDGRFYLKDLKSRNGTFVNDVRVEDSVPLNPGDRIRVGSTTFVFEQEGAADPAAAVAQVQGEMGEGKGYSTILREIVEDIPAPPPAAEAPAAPAPAAEAPRPAGRPAIKLGGIKKPAADPAPAAQPPAAAPATGGAKKITIRINK